MLGIALILFVIFIFAIAEVFISPGQRHFQFGFVVNLLIDTATQFGHIHRLDFHSQPGFKEVVINNGTGDTHRNAAQRQIAFTFHAGDGQTGAGKAQQFFFNIGRNRCVIGILNVMTVNGECRDAFLAVSCQSRCQVNSAGTFSAVKAPNGFRAGWIHVDGFTAIAPARRYRNGEAYILTAEFFFASSGFSHTRDTGIGNDTLDGSSAGMAQFLGQQCGRSFRHIHCLFFKRLTNTHATTVNNRADTNFR